MTAPTRGVHAVRARALRRMRAVRFLGKGRIELRDVPVPEPERGELLLRVEASALCGSDRRAFETGSSVTPGHETAGSVVASGAGTSVGEGTRGSVFLVAFCDRCQRCSSGSRGACLQKEGMLGFDRDGGFAEYQLVPERCFLPVDSALTTDDAVMLLDMTGTPLHALRRAGALASPPPVAAVVGAGPVGLACVLALRACGVQAVLALDVVAFRLDFARRLGAQPIPAGEGAAERVRAAVAGLLPLVIEASGNPAGQRLAIDILGAGGTLVVLGHSPAPLEVWPTPDLIQQEKTVLGSEYFDTGEFVENQRLVLDGRLAPRRLVTHRLPLESIEEGYRAFWSGESGKVVIYPTRDS
jgi:threonine 3-dehydrogenase